LCLPSFLLVKLQLFCGPHGTYIKHVSHIS